jgi:hypothetical protein
MEIVVKKLITNVDVKKIMLQNIGPANSPKGKR